MTLNKQALREAAEKATPGPWRRASTQFNGITHGKFSLTNEDVIASSPEKCNAIFIAAANPSTVLALLDELEAAEKRIAELESRTVTLPTPYPKGYGLVADKYNFALEECADAIRAAGIGVKGE